MGKEIAKLYLRFPSKINEELDVKNLCPLIEAVHLPRQKSARWCFVDFKTTEIMEEALKVLKKIRINDKRLVIKSHRMKSKQNTQKKCDSIDTVQELLVV